MNKQRMARKNRRYDRGQMPPIRTPIDAMLRIALRNLKPDQKAVAKRIGRSQGWLNKYLDGRGKATIDDVIRLVAVVMLDVDASPPLTRDQRKLLRLWAASSPSDRKAAMTVLKRMLIPREPRSGSTGRGGQNSPKTTGTGPGTR